MSCCGDDSQVTEVTPAQAKTTKTIDMTHEAAQFAQELMKKYEKEGWGLKIEVIPGGCAGYKYFMDFQQEPDKGDKTYEIHGVKIFMSLFSAGLIKGSTIEFISSLESTGLKINNPNATRGCGCGKSFG